MAMERWSEKMKRRGGEKREDGAEMDLRDSVV